MSLGFARASVVQLLAEHTPLPAEHGRCELCNYTRHPCEMFALCNDWLAMDDALGVAPSSPFLQALAELDQWQKLAVARGTILTAYRNGGRPPGRAIDAAEAARDQLHLMGRTP